MLIGDDTAVDWSTKTSSGWEATLTVHCWDFERAGRKSVNATVPFKPAIRISPADDAPIVTARPTCTMVLSDDQQAVWECNPNGVYQPKTFTAFEVFS